MSCSVAVCNSPVFSPSSSLFCNKSSILSSPQESLSHRKPQTSSPSSPSTTVSSPKSPFRLRFQKPPSGFAPGPLSFGSESVSASSPPGGVLKRKRPTRLDIPIGVAGFVAPISSSAAVAATPREECREVEREGDGYSVYCKRGRREAMEVRFSAITNLHGDRKQVISNFKFIFQFRFRIESNWRFWFNWLAITTQIRVYHVRSTLIGLINYLKLGFFMMLFGENWNSE